MAIKRSGLGRGLSNLIPDAPAAKADHSSEFQYLNLDQVDPNPDQPRRSFNEKELTELADTIQHVGIIEPIVVRPKNDRYIIISGERRWRASKLIGYKKIPAVIKDFDELKAAEVALIENLQRQDLNSIEEARAYESLLQLTGDKPANLAKKVGKDRTTITNLLRLLKLPDEVLTLIENKMINAGQARPLLSLGDRKTVIQLSARISKEGWSARRVEDEVAKLTEIAGPKKAKSSGKDANTRKIEERIRARLTAKVDLAHKASGGGRLSIQYTSLDDLERILDLIGVKR
ncbi:MAG: ParB/RepB/Spo0J family partition protein [Leptonema sp. (in: Bacteria)]|nr:ParB/RepB/Spo0J family partition protein [Leptonema sp. (in: bacteria)]